LLSSEPGKHSYTLEEVREVVPLILKAACFESPVGYTILHLYYRGPEQNQQMVCSFLKFYKWRAHFRWRPAVYLDHLSEYTMYFEWIEIDVHTMKDEEIPAFDEQGDLLESPVIINPEYRLLHLQYPVHKMPAADLVQNKGDYFVLAYRHQDTLSVKFFELSALFGVVFEILANNSVNARTALSSAAEMFNIEDEQELIQNSLPFLNDLVAQGIILGFEEE